MLLVPLSSFAIVIVAAADADGADDDDNPVTTGLLSGGAALNLDPHSGKAMLAVQLAPYDSEKTEEESAVSAT